MARGFVTGQACHFPWFAAEERRYRQVKMEATATTGPAFLSFALPKLTRRRIQVIKVHKANLSDSKQKKAYLFATRKERIGLPNYDVGSGGKTFHIREFLSDPSGVEAILNAKALKSFQSLGSDLYRSFTSLLVYIHRHKYGGDILVGISVFVSLIYFLGKRGPWRCTLPRIQLLNFEVVPVVDLRVTSTSEVCTVEMLSCTFEGSEIMERQNKHFSASMRNQITWDTNNSEPFLDIDVELNLALEIYTKPFTLLPISAVEGPGNLCTAQSHQQQKGEGVHLAVSVAVLVNENGKGRLGASNEIRQGDPLSPFLFVITIDLLTRMISRAEEVVLLWGL
ncbi:hypothetical protein CK203_003801 [Vitis vinifera]|uniref:Uncharacterized protein n=1 Tax=Vitis vinifera TaxID=29760 RepID=A0A438K804_VITVI|nr:hypothetical protein CK203_003801 [Vitis vinifera]